MRKAPLPERNGSISGDFEKANGGTLFLDEIGDLPFDIQVRLLRVLERKEFERVGGTETIRSDFRLIVATNRDLEQEVKENRFRADLFYRINVFPINIPPLRERRQDIPMLIHHYIKVLSDSIGNPFQEIPEEEMIRLTRYDWPGNVRELKNIIERYVISNTGDGMGISQLLYTGGSKRGSGKHSVTLKENERRHVLWALSKTKWKIHGPGGAAELLDIHPNTLTYRIKKLGVKRP